MNITVNGEKLQLEKAVSVAELLAIREVEMPQYVTVQVNDELVDRGDFGTTFVKDEDCVEFLFFMGGGGA